MILITGTVDTNLNWKKHTKKVANRCSKKIGVLNRIKYVLPLCIKTMLYNRLILPHITYGIMVWGYQGNRLNKIQKKAIRIITSSKYNSHTEPLFKQLIVKTRRFIKTTAIEILL